MKNAEMKVIKFDGNDVIATSGILQINGVFDGVNNNATITINGKTYTNTDDGGTVGSDKYNSDLVNAFNTTFGSGAFNSIDVGNHPELKNHTLYGILYYDGGNGGPTDTEHNNLSNYYNGSTWKWNGSAFIRQ